MTTKNMILTANAEERKRIPITTGVLDYFPRAIAAVAQCSKAGNDQHHKGEPLHWDKTKSTDHADCIARHLVDRAAYDTDGLLHAVKLAWRALALLETMLDQGLSVSANTSESLSTDLHEKGQSSDIEREWSKYSVGFETSPYQPKQPSKMTMI